MRIFFFVAILLLAACKSSPFIETSERVKSKVKTFEDVVRWGALEKMYYFQKVDPQNPPEIPPGLDNVRVTSYEIGVPLNEAGPNRWTQTVVIGYVLTDRQVVRQLVDYQVWVSDDDGQSWYRETPVPEFR